MNLAIPKGVINNVGNGVSIFFLLRVGKYLQGNIFRKYPPLTHFRIV